MTGTRTGLIAAAALVLAAAPLAGQGAPARALSLDEALRISEGASEQVEVSRAGVTRARGQQLQARSQRLPQLSGSLSYQRALASEFEGIGGGGAPDSTQGPPGPDPATCTGRFVPNPALPVGERLDSLERAVECAGSANPFAAFGNLPFGRENTWRLGLNLTQNVFTGGRLTAQNRIADAARTAAEVGLASSRAQLALDVTQAYYDAQLADRLVGIAESTLEQAERTLRQTQLGRQVGNVAEFELLRAQVTRDNQRPVLIQRRSDRDLAYLRLRQLLNVPLDQPLSLTTALGDAEGAAPVERFTAAESAPGDTAAEARAAVRQAAEAVRIQEAQLRIARSQRLPNVAVSSSYGRVAYPGNLALPDFLDAAENWTVSAALSVPIFTGGRIRGEELEARAGVDEARARLQQTRELATLDARSSLQRLAAAQASYAASTGTVTQAQRAYGIAEVRFAEGLSTQVELSDARLLLQQAVANRALAARDLQIARARVRLLPDLPFDMGGGAPQGGAQQQQPAPQQQRQQAPQGTAADPSQAGFTGAGVP